MIWLIGCGGMAMEYFKVLRSLKKECTVIGRGKSSAEKFQKQTGQSVVQGGLNNFLRSCPAQPEAAIVCTSIPQLNKTTIELLDYGIKRILLEKPGGLYAEEFEKIYGFSSSANAQIYIAYNRRFYSSINKIQGLIAADGGITSFNFEFTEWSHQIENHVKHPEELSRWLVSNSSHVLDLAFYLGGRPTQISCFTTGSLEWHSCSSIFSGAGISDKGALFSYQANWSSAGRWSIEVLTDKNRYFLSPLESLRVQEKGSLQVNPVHLDNELDEKFKPGLYLQVSAFLGERDDQLCSIKEHASMFPVYEKIGGYQ